MFTAKAKALINFAVTAKLICVFVFAYAKRWFSHDAAPIYYLNVLSWSAGFARVTVTPDLFGKVETLIVLVQVFFCASIA